MSVQRLFLGVIALTALHAAATQIIPGHIPIAASTAQPAGPLDPTRNLVLAIELPLQHEDQLNALLKELYDQPDARRRHYLSVQEFTAQFGPSHADFNQVIAFARRNGFKITELPANRLLLGVSAPVAQIEKAFHIHLRQYQHPTEARLFFAPDAEPSVDLAVPVLHISGLDNFDRPKPGAKISPPPSASAGLAIPRIGSGPGGAYLGKDFRAAYAPDVTLTGAGQSLALVEFDGYFPVNITAYEILAGLPFVPLTNVLVNNFSGTPGSGENGVLEDSINIEMAAAMAPGLSRIIVYETGLYSAGSTLFNRIASDNLARQISCSWWFNSGNGAAIKQALMEFAAQGQSFFIISADNGAFSSANPVYPPLDYNYTTVVGGTVLFLDTNRAWTSETVWGDSGGGISSSALIPTWQEPVSMSANGGSTTHRNIPDVAAVAEGIYVVYDNGAAGSGVGTSFAAPLWAGFAALANEQAAANGLPSLGYINPAIYQIGLSDFYATAFHDIVVGNNTDNTSPNAFFAEPGYDLCTGWGSPIGANLINLLAPPPIVLSAPAVTAGQIEFTISNLEFSSTNYLQTSSNLVTWKSIATNYPTGPTLTVTTPAPTNSSLFFRVLER